MNVVDRFGFLSVSCRYSNNEIKIYPIEEFDRLLQEMQEYEKDGFLYPHYEVKSNLYKLSATHIIEFSGEEASLERKDLRLGIMGFLIHLVGYIYGRRSQFHDWYFDKRIPFKGQHNIHISTAVFEKFFEYSLRTFRSWDAGKQRYFINILYMHNMVPSYEWDWERFAIEYMVLDACWKFSGLKAKTHGERIWKICSKYKMYKDEGEINRIVDLRNDLFHEALWGKVQPGTLADTKTFYASYNLRRLNHRLIPAILGYESDYIKSNWTNIGSFIF